MKMTTKQINLRLPAETVRRVRAAAKLASVTPTQIYNVILALAVVAGPMKERQSAAPHHEQEEK